MSGETIHTSEARDKLKSFVERIERLAEERESLGDEQRALFAEAKADGFDPKSIRRIIKRRQKEPSEIAEWEAIDDSYMHALGMAVESPLHVQVAKLAGDGLAREQLIDAFQLLIPVNGEIIARVGGNPMRLWRTESGQAMAEVYVAPKAASPAEKTGRAPKASATVLAMVPKDHVKAAADAAERRAKAKRGEDESTPMPEDESEPAE
jgi:uncharacterized protein (UPF0335 family)